MDLLEQYRAIAAKGDQFRGLSILRYAEQIGELVQLTGAVRLLDYGSGAGDGYRDPWFLHEHWGIQKPTLYDPAFPGHDALPEGTFDGVICADVLEHVPIDEVRPLIRTLFGYARGFIWASVCCRLAKKCFPDGTNMHVTVQPYEWWRRLFEAEAKRTGLKHWQLVETP